MSDVDEHQDDADEAEQLGHVFGMQEAADACDVSRDTIKRRRAAGRFPNAYKDDGGAWRIPLADLLADGLHPNAAGAPRDVAAAIVEQRTTAARTAALDAEVRELRARLDERERALRAAEQGRTELAEMLRAALAKLPDALPAGAAPPAEGDVPHAPPRPTDAPPARRRWFRRS